MKPPGLSKSRILSSLQCLKKVYLEANRRELARYSPATEAAFALGHEVGEMAVQLYGADGGTYIEYAGGNFARPLAQTQQLMNSMFRAPVFEATLRHEGVLVREDVLLPVDEGEASWRIVEVKASTKVKPEYLHDCAVQAWVHRGAGYPLASISLAHVDNQFTYPGDGDYRGLLVEHDLTAAVRELLPSVPLWVERAREAVAGPEPDVGVGQHCTSPNECPFIHYCWPGDTEYPVTALGGGRKRLGVWVMNGYRDVRDVPAAEIGSEQQLRIHRVTLEGRPELLPGARAFAQELPFPRFYLDFEAVAPAIPLWAGTRPYQHLPFQFSCHIERSPGEMEHVEFLDLSGEPPMRPLAERLIRDLEKRGPVLMYTPYERRIIDGLATLLPDLQAPLTALVDRLVDLAPVTKVNYYHADMLGSWSIKSVLPTIAPEMDYASLAGIREGNEAAAAYREAIAAETTAGRKAVIREELLTYCRHDTEAMVRLVHFFRDATA